MPNIPWTFHRKWAKQRKKRGNCRKAHRTDIKFSQNRPFLAVALIPPAAERRANDSGPFSFYSIPFPASLSCPNYSAMAVNSSTHLAPLPLRSLPRSSFALFSRIFMRPASAAAFPGRSLVSVRAQTPSSEGYGSKQPLGLEDSGPSVGSTGSPSSSSVIDFLTLCHSLKVSAEFWLCDTDLFMVNLFFFCPILGEHQMNYKLGEWVLVVLGVIEILVSLAN